MANITRKESSSRGRDLWRDFFDMDFFGSGFPTLKSNMPAVNLSEDDKNYTVEVVAPGFRKEDFRLRVNEDVLTISAETKNEVTEPTDSRDYRRREYSRSSFTRTFRLPDNARDDSISASYHEGILEINIPKSEKETKASKEISIK